MLRSMLFGSLLFAVCAACGAQGLALDLPRHAYFRGESIPVSLQLPRAMTDARLEVSLNGRRVAAQPFRGPRGIVAVPTAAVKVGRYTLKAVVRSGAGA